MTPAQKPNVLAETGTAARYILAGLVGNGLVLLTHYLFSLGLGWDPRISFTSACACVLPIAFLLSRNWSFRSDAPLKRAFLLFCGGYGASFLLQFGILYLGLVLGIRHEIVVPTGQVLAVLFFYSVQRFVIFAPRASNPSRRSDPGSGDNHRFDQDP